MGASGQTKDGTRRNFFATLRSQESIRNGSIVSDMLARIAHPSAIATIKV
jgi:hypothetical protein